MPPRMIRTVSDEARRRAVNAILDRRRHVDDPDLEKATDDPLDLVNYVLKHQRASRKAIRADVLDALTLLEWARRRAAVVLGTLDRLEHQLLELGITVGLQLTEMGVPLGCRKTTVHNRLMRGRAVQAGLPSNEKALRAQHRGDVWFAANAKRLIEVANQLPPYAEFVDDEEEEFADGLYELGESLALLSSTTTSASSPEVAVADYPQLRIITARLRVIIREITAPEFEVLRAKLDQPLKELTTLTVEHSAVIEYA